MRDARDEGELRPVALAALVANEGGQADPADVFGKGPVAVAEFEERVGERYDDEECEGLVVVEDWDQAGRVGFADDEVREDLIG